MVGSFTSFGGISLATAFATFAFAALAGRCRRRQVAFFGHVAWLATVVAIPSPRLLCFAFTFALTSFAFTVAEVSDVHGIRISRRTFVLCERGNFSQNLIIGAEPT